MTSDPFAPPPPPPPPPYLPPPTVGGGSGEPIPWEDRARLGVVPAFIENFKLFATAPAQGFARMKEQGDYASPLLFGVGISWIGLVLAAIWSFAIGRSPLPFLPESMRGLSAAGQGVGAFVGQVVFGPVLVVCGLFIGAAIIHLFLMLFGALKDSRAGFEGTVRALSYSAVAQVANIVPFVGGFAAGLWALVLYVIGLAIVHKTSQGKAAAAVLVPIVLCCVCIAMFFGTIMALVAGAAASSMR